jgi:hypothetical protein
MKLNSIVIVVIVIVVLAGGFLAVNAFTGDTKTTIMDVPITTTTVVDNATGATIAVPDFNTPYKPAEIAGTNSFADISKMFNVPLMDLGNGFGITSEPNWQGLKARELKAIYTNLPANIKLETESVRAFVALYTGKAYAFSTSAYIPKPGVDILKQKARLTPDQVAYLDSHTYTGTAGSAGTAVANKHTVTGETPFGALLSWGIPASEIEKVIGDKIPAPAMLIRDYASQKGKDFLAMVAALQVLANR